MIANDPRTIALHRQRALLEARRQEEAENGEERPRMKTVNVEIDLEVGCGMEKGEEGWRGVMPLTLEFHPDSLPPPYNDSKSPVPTQSPHEEPKYVRLTVLVALPSASGRRHRREDVVLDAMLADSQGRPLGGSGHVDVQHGLPEAAIGIYQERYTDGE